MILTHENSLLFVFYFTFITDGKGHKRFSSKPSSMCKAIQSLHPLLKYITNIINVTTLNGSYDAISSFPFSLECYKLFVHR